jgi:hypothetical protein
MSKSEYRISRWWHTNSRKESITVYIPRKFADAHKMMENPYVQIINREDGVLIKPLEPTN